MKHLIAGAIVEFAGTFALMLVGGAAILHGESLLVVAMAHGLILAVMVTAGMHISGGQFNPAVSAALALIGEQSWARAGVFAVSQLAGGVVAAWMLTGMFDAQAVETGKLGATLGSVTDDVAMLLLLEFVATAMLMFVILGSAVDQRGIGKSATVGGFAIGLVVAANILCFGPFTGASMNPARSFGPALVGGYWRMHAVYWLAPIAGACLMALLWRFVLGGVKHAPVQPFDPAGHGQD